MKNIRIILLSIASLLGSFETTGCSEAADPPAAPALTSVTYQKPHFTPLAETKETQEKGGITISVAPIAYAETASDHVDEQEVERYMVRTYTVGGAATDTPVRKLKRVTTASYSITPDRVSFTVKVDNKMSRVFRGAGTLVQFNVGGKLSGTDQSGYVELANLIVPPRTEAEVHVFGPPLASLGEKTTLGLFLYDVVTQTDAAGNITGKENFEWYYTYMSEPISKQVAQKVEYIQQPIGATTIAPQQPQRRRH